MYNENILISSHSFTHLIEIILNGYVVLNLNYLSCHSCYLELLYLFYLQRWGTDSFKLNFTSINVKSHKIA